MNREDDIIDLGAASAETLGQPGTELEFGVIGRALGIADE